MKHPWSAVALSLVLAVTFLSASHADEYEIPDKRTLTRVSSIEAYEIKRVPKTRVYIEALNQSEQEVLAFRRHLIEAGAEKVNLFLPNVIVCDVPESLNPVSLISNPGYTFFEERSMGPSRVAAMSDNMRWAHVSYELAWESAHGVGASTPLPDGFNDVVLTVPPEVAKASREAAMAKPVTGSFMPRGVDQNAEFMIGSILVRFVMPESNGGLEANQETWTESWLTNAVSGGASACLAFQETFNYLPMNYIFEEFRAIATVYEPITHNMDTDALWISNTLETLGFGGYKELDDAVHAFNEQGRSRFGTDWAYTAFIANSRNEPFNIFSGATGGAGYTAYATLGGPYFVIPYPAGANDPNELGEEVVYSKIYQHEMVHVFWGLDEYVSAPTSCDSRMGYLRVWNLNKISQGPDGSQTGCPGWVPCIMWGAREDDGRPVCRWTAGQIGVVDEAPQNDVPDVFDSRPIVTFTNSAVETVTTPEITLGINIRTDPVPNQNPVQDHATKIHYAAPLRTAVITVGGVEAILTPTDGKWNEPDEECSFSFTGLTAGLTTVFVRATSSFGLQSGNYQKKIYFIGLNYGQFDFDIRNEAIIVNFNLVGETFGASMNLYRVYDGKSEMIVEGLVGVEQENSPFTNFRYDDKDVEPGASYSYFVTGVFELSVQGTSQMFESTSNVFDVRAMVPMPKEQLMSRSAPNPFSDRTAVSVRVPESRAEIITIPTVGGPQLTPTRPVPTNVEVTVYDVKGRFVRTVYRGGLFKQVFTVEWDGRNENGDAVSSGIYFIKSIAGPHESTRKVVVVR